MSRAPIDSAASVARRKLMLAGEDKRRDAARQRLVGDGMEQEIASRASRQGEASRIKRNAREHLPKLSTEIVRLDEDDVTRGPQPLIAREHQSSVASSMAKQMRTIQIRVHDDVSAKQPQPSPQPHQHPIGSELRGLLHIDGVYYSNDPKRPNATSSDTLSVRGSSGGSDERRAHYIRRR